MASTRAKRGAADSGPAARWPLPTRWELWELAIQATLLPFTALPRGAGLAGCRALAALLIRRHSAYRTKMAALMPPTLRDRLGPGATRALRRSESLILYDRVMVLRGLLFPWWRRPVQIAGMAAVREARAQGHGVILWVQPCVGSSLEVKAAMHRAGMRLVHLTRPSHGFSGSPFGLRFVNPMLRRAENRFLDERIVIDEGRTVGPLRQLRKRLEEKRVVSITVTTAASNVNALPFLGGRGLLPEGPIVLAEATRAVLLPVFTVGSGARARVIVGEALPVGRGEAAIRACQEATMRWLESQVAAHPEAWIGWRAGLWKPAATD